MPASFNTLTYFVGSPADVVTNLTPASTQNLTIESSLRKSNGKFTPNGLSVNFDID